jgi:hydrogenase expression/formation protein HypC
MCLSVPAKIIEIQGETARVSLGGAKVNASLQLLDDARVGEYVLLHTGFAIQKLDPEEAAETFRLLRELGNVDQTDGD